MIVSHFSTHLKTNGHHNKESLLVDLLLVLGGITGVVLGFVSYAKMSNGWDSCGDLGRTLLAYVILGSVGYGVVFVLLILAMVGLSGLAV